MTKIYQIFYDRPYNPSTLYAVLLFINIIYLSLYTEIGPQPSLLAPCIGSRLGLMIGICTLAILSILILCTGGQRE